MGRGTVVRVGPQPGDFTVALTRVYKGAPPANLTVVEGTASASSCVLPVAKGEDIVVFALVEGAAYSATLCGGTGSATPALVAEVEAIAGEGRAVTAPPLPPEPQSRARGWAFGGLGVVVLAVAAAAVWGSRRRSVTRGSHA